MVAQPNAKRTLSLDDVGPASRGAATPRPTTLEGAAAEVTSPPRRRPGTRERSRTPVVAGVSAAVALVAVGGYLLFSKPGKDANDKPVETTTATARPEVQTPPPPKPVPPVDDTVTITVNSDPPGAKVIHAATGQSDQRTPVTFKLKKGTPPFDIQLRIEGYAPQVKTITADESIKMLVSLAKLPPAVAPPAPAVAHETRPKHIAPESVSATPRPKRRTPKANSTAPTPAPDDDMTIIQPNF
jgi:hypothetical protein